MRSLAYLSESISFVMDQNAEEKTLILQASSPVVSDTLFDSSHAQRLQTKRPPAKSWWVQKLSADFTAD
jgi:hypothetical protein